MNSTRLAWGMMVLAVPATLSNDDYLRKGLADASRWVAQRQQAETASAGIRQKITSALGLGRFYKTGDSWLVAVSYLNPGMVRGTDGPEARKDVYLSPLFYEFHVLSTNADTAEVEVTRVGVDGQPLATNRVQRVVVTIDSQLRLRTKQYYFDAATEPVVAELGGERNVPMGFDSFPIDLPDFDAAKLLPAGDSGQPKLPGGLARHFTRKLDPAQTVRFESPDLFARPVRVEWQRGDLWPAYVETTSSRSILVRQVKR